MPLVGALDEWHQFYVPRRDGSVYDWVADAVGTMMAVYVYSRRIGLRERNRPIQ